MSKLREDKTVWYEAVLPEAAEECLFEEKNGTLVLARLSDKRWQKKTVPLILRPLNAGLI